MFDLTLSGIPWFLLALFIVYIIISPSLARAAVSQQIELMDLYPQAANQRPSVAYIPTPYRREGEQPVGGDKPPPRRRSNA
jgi:hypothetical protein